jgi:signal transduction histidine kinase
LRPRRGDAAAYVERLILAALVVVRAAALAQGGLSVAGSWPVFTRPLLVLAGVGVLAGSSVAVVGMGLRRGAVGPPWIAVVDVGCTLGVLVGIDMLIRRSADPALDNVLYPYSAVSMAVVGFLPVRLRWACAAAAAATLVYVEAATARFGFRSGLAENAATYWGYALVSWVLARWFREMSLLLDEASDRAVIRERELERAERERERLTTCRALHDRILQTLESMSRGGRRDDERLRREIAREAAWLRALIQNELDPEPPGLVAALQLVVCTHAEQGLDVELNTAAAAAHPVPEPVIEALAGAVTEALTNVRKHAGCSSCVVRAAVDSDHAVVTVVDDGRGFDHARIQPGIGMTQSIVARMLEVGGVARVSTEPGAGTRWELRVPLAGPSAPAAAGPAPEPGAAALAGQGRRSSLASLTSPKLGI